MSEETSERREDVSSILLFLTAIGALCLVGGIYLQDGWMIVASTGLVLFWGIWSIRHIRMIRKQNAQPPAGDA